MANEDFTRRHGIIEHTSGSRADLIMIYVYNHASYGEAAADRYLRFLEEKLQVLAHDPRLGRMVEEYPNVHSFMIQVRPRKGKHGHRVFYRPTETGIEVIRILHTAMNWSEHLSD